MPARKAVDEELLPRDHLEESRLTAFAIRLVPLIVGILTGSLITFVVNKESIDDGGALTSCRYALGGGAVPGGGSFPQAQIKDGSCTSQFHKYLAKQYDKDVETSIASARQYFGAYFQTPNASQVIVFDIDETALSNRAEWLNMLDSRKQGLSSSLKSFAEAKAKNDKAPALKPTLDLYTDLFYQGFSVTFITGRTDANDTRTNTAKNLEAAGYGVACSDAQLRAHGRDDKPCYVELGMRVPDEVDLLASVYKPMQRKKLQEKGFEILGSFGDQFSDLEGTSTAAASFKLPNPFYYIL